MPAPENTELSALWLAGTDSKAKAVAICQKALRDTNGHRAKAAKKLNVGLRTFYRWLDTYPEILKGVDNLRFLAVTKKSNGARNGAKKRTRTS